MTNAAGIELLESGQPPRRRLRYAFEAGTLQELTVRLTSTAQGSTVAVGSDLCVSLPLLVRIVSVSGDGTARFELELGPIPVKDLERLGESADLAEARVTGSGAVSSQGVAILDHFVASGSSVLERLRPLVEQALPFPSQPIGVGARWTTLERREADELPYRQSTEYTLVAVDGEQVEARLQGELRPLTSAGPPMHSEGSLRARIREPFPVGTLATRTVLEAPELGRMVVESSVRYAAVEQAEGCDSALGATSAAP